MRFTASPLSFSVRTPLHTATTTRSDPHHREGLALRAYRYFSPDRVVLVVWSARKESDLPPLPCQGSALPMSYAPIWWFLKDSNLRKHGVSVLSWPLDERTLGQFLSQPATAPFLYRCNGQPLMVAEEGFEPSRLTVMSRAESPSCSAMVAGNGIGPFCICL